MLPGQTQDLKIGAKYKLTEFVERIKVSSGNYFLVSFHHSGTEKNPVLGFCKSQNGQAEYFLNEAHAQFGDPKWRRVFKNANGWNIYPGPIGSITWTSSYVEVDVITP